MLIVKANFNGVFGEVEFLIWLPASPKLGKISKDMAMAVFKTLKSPKSEAL